MTDVKCPFCNGELVGTIGHPICRNPNCVMCDDPMPQDLLEELIRIRKELEQSETCCTEWEKQALDYKAENIALSGDLERTRKVLETLQEFITKLYLNGNITDEQLERYKKMLITALEQKEE